jgi:hypothetical protein
MRRILFAGAAVGLVAALGLAGPAQATPATNDAPKSTVGIFHGVPKTPVDVYVGKTKVVDDFQPGTFAGPLSLAPGLYTVRITAADATSWKQAIITKTVRFGAGKNHSVIAHLSAKGKPVITKYTNDLSPVAAGQARLTVRHVGAAPAVDVRLNGQVAVAGLTNPREAKAVVKAGGYTAGAYLAGTHSIVIGPVHYDVKAGTNTIIYAWGNGQVKGDLAFTVRALPLK